MMAALRLGVVDKSLMELRGLCEILGPGGVEGVEKNVKLEFSK